MEILRLLGPRLSLNSISAHNFAEAQHLKAHLAVHKFDVLCLSKIYLNSSFPFGYDNLDVPGYIIVRADNPANRKRGGVCIIKTVCHQRPLISDFFMKA